MLWVYTITNENNQSQKNKSFINVSNTVWYLERRDWKRSSTTSSAFSLIIICMLSLFECITLSSSVPLQEIKLIATDNWNFQVSDFLKIFISFKYHLILLSYSSIDSVSYSI